MSEKKEKWHRDIWASAVWESTLKPLERLVAFAYADHAPDNRTTAYVVGDRLRGRTGLSRDAVNRALRGLEAAGWLVVVKAAGQHSSTTYSLALPASDTSDGTLSDTSGVLLGSSVPSPDASVPSPDASVPPDGNNLSTTSGTTSKRPAPADADDEFSEFYELYPRKKSKPTAVKEWKTATKTKKVQPAVILDGLRRHLPALKAQMAEEPKYVAYPGTWLKEERWSEDVEQAPEQPLDPMWRTLEERTCPTCARPDVNTQGVCTACRADELISGMTFDEQMEAAFSGTAADPLIPVGVRANGGPNSRAAADAAKPWKLQRRTA